LVGGTGQYIMAVIEGWGIPEVSPRLALREQLELLGESELNRWLQTLDAVAAEKIDRRNIRRVVRALEVTLVTGKPISVLQRKTPPEYDICIIGLKRSRENLYARIDQRVEKMMADGLLEEVIALKEAGYDRSLSSMSGLGYRQIMAYLEGEVSLDEAIERTKFETHRFARQQNTWFRQDDPRIHWFDLGISGSSDEAIKLGQDWLADKEIWFE
jgi:tRNA dimethylallyltransferase